MTNLNKVYHKGRFRSGEWAKHLRPYLKRKGNKKFRKVALSLDDGENYKLGNSKRKREKKRIKVKITLRVWNDSTVSYYKSYRSFRDMNNAINRPNVIRYLILNDSVKTLEKKAK